MAPKRRGCACAVNRNWFIGMLLRALLSLCLLLAAADARVLSASSNERGRGAMRGGSGAASRTSVIVAKGAAAAASLARSRQGMFEPPRGAERRSVDVSDHEACMIGAISAGACSCM